MQNTQAGISWRVRYRRVLMLAPVLVSVLAIGLLLAVVDWQPRQFEAMSQRLTQEGLVVLALLFGLQQLGRATRLRALMAQAPDTRRLVEIVMIHQFCDYLLPLKAGELSLPELLKREGVERPVACAMLVVMRGCDLLLATLLLLGTLVFLHDEIPEALSLTVPLIIVAGGLLGGLAVTIRWASRRTPDGRTRDVARYGNAIRYSAGKLGLFRDALGALSARQYWRAVLSTLGISLAGIAFNLFFCWQFAPDLRWQSALLVVLAMPLISQIPIRGWAGIGTSEATLVFLFCQAGMPAPAAFSLAICGRIFHFLLLSSSGLAAFCLYLRGRAQAATSGLAIPSPNRSSGGAARP